MTAKVYHGDCLKILKRMPSESIHLVYLDPPFLTQKIQKLATRDRIKSFEFSDIWNSKKKYPEFLYKRLIEMHRVLRSSGSIFLHCDRNASHIARFLLDEIFSRDMFRAEIIWHYRRWSNSQENLLPAHQNILFYSKTSQYRFHKTYQAYSPATNVDQILQKRKRDAFGKAIYARNEKGEIILNGYKKGVSLSDVWDIPYLNPKAKERTGYPTQKPILLLERIILLATDEGDLVLDPFCGSGTTLVAAKLLRRNSIGIDTSADAVEITKERLRNPSKTKSYLLQAGRDAYENVNEEALIQLSGLDIVPIQRNKGMDAFLKLEYKGGPVPIRVQRPGETLSEVAHLLYRAGKSKNASAMIIVATKTELNLGFNLPLPPGVIIVDSINKAISELISKWQAEQTFNPFL